MGEALHASRFAANNTDATFRVGEPTEQTVFQIVANSRDNQKEKWFPKLARLIAKDKPAAAIHHLTREKERTCFDWCAGAVDPPSRVIIKLLHSPVGNMTLHYLMRGCKEPWWVELQKARVCAAAYEQARDQLEMPV